MPRITSAIIFVALLFCLVAPAHVRAEFVWVDHNGNTRHTKFPPKAHQVKKWVSNGEAQQKKQAQVELFVTSWCPYCHKAKQFFDERNVPVKVYDIEKDPRAAAKKRRLDSRSGVPFAVVNGKAIHGYAPDLYLRALQGK